MAASPRPALAAATELRCVPAAPLAPPQACALWIPETFMSLREVPGVGRREFVAGLEKVKPERWEGRCAICGLTDGAVMACQQPSGCGNAFHVLCARNIGLYLSEWGAGAQACACAGVWGRALEGLPT